MTSTSDRQIGGLFDKFIDCKSSAITRKVRILYLEPQGFSDG